MKVVIQCAGGKDPAAGYMADSAGQKVKFVAHPEKAPVSKDLLYARPDDLAPGGTSWRSLLLEYNERSDNPFGLYEAYRLYANPAYRALVNAYGVEKVLILSAGWGLIRASFLTPQYDITFLNSADDYKRRRKQDKYHDLCELALDDNDSLVFFGGKDYLPLFCKLTQGYRGQRHVFYNSKVVPSAPGCNLIRYPTTTRTNWHYSCATDFIAKRVSITK